MFCDLVGSTALSGQLDPEDLNEVTREYQSACAQVIERYGGQIAQFIGDGLLVYFGYPVSHEDDAQRAVHAGLEMIGAIAAARERLATPLQVRIGINTGLVVVGHLGGGTNPDPLAISGETPNIASRLQAIADPGHVVVSASTYRLIEGFFFCRSLGSPALRGVVRTTEVFEVLEPTGIQTPFERAVASGLTPFVNREKELQQLLELWQEARAGRGQVVMLSGEAGIGKSRLLQSLKEQTADEPVWELGGRCSAYYQDSALFPAIDFLQRMLRFRRSDDAETKLAKLEDGLMNFGFNLPDAMPLFAALLSLPFQNRYPARPLTPQRQKQLTFEALAEWLMRIARRGPARVIVEDLHWADPSSLELIEFLIDRFSAARLMLILVFRPEFIPSWQSQPNVIRIDLGRLPQDTTGLMAQSLAGAKQLPAIVVGDIVAKTEGVPLFVEELTQMVLESGLLIEHEGQYILSGPLPSLAIPSTLYDSLMARLDRLGTAKEVAQLAAAIGKEFSYELLRAISPMEETRLTGARNRLVDAELLEQNLEQGRLRYSFRHALIRNAAYDSLLRSQRRQYHRKVAEAMAEHLPDTVEARPELLAHHITEAGMREEAISYWQKASQRALERSANKEAIQHLTKGLELVSPLPQSLQRDEQELHLQIALGTVSVTVKGFASPDVERAYRRARQLCQQVSDGPRLFPVLWGLWLFYTARAEHLTAQELALQCLGLARKTGDSGLLVEAHHVAGVGLIGVGDFVQALGHLQDALSLYDRRQHSSLAYVYAHDPSAVGLVHKAWTLWFLGYPDQALKAYREGARLAQELRHPYTSVTVNAFAAWFQFFCGNSRAVTELASSTLTLSIEHEFAFYRPLAEIMLGWSLTQTGELSRGLAEIRSGLNAHHENGAEAWRPAFLGLLAEAQAKTAQIDEALALVNEALMFAEKSHERWWLAEVFRLKGELVLRSISTDAATEQQDEAERLFRQALAIAQEQKAKSLELRAATSLCRLWREQGKKAEAKQLLLPVYSWFTEGFDTRDLQEARALLEQTA